MNNAKRLTKGTDGPNTCCSCSAIGCQQIKHALIRTVGTGDTKTVVDLLDRGVLIDTKDDKGKSLLHWAAEGAHVTTMRLLIRKGCDVDSVDDRGLTPLHWTSTESTSHRCDVDSVDGRGLTPLH